jgi:hypothetical protein
MGLDMYLEGRTFQWGRDEDLETRDGFRVKGHILDLGYWRKHPNLHGFIVETFADGKDECQEISLDADALRTIIAAVKEQKLPHTEGFFFGTSSDDEEQRNEDVAILSRALAWLEGETPPTMRDPEPIGAGLTATMVKPDDFVSAKESRDVIYLASW